MTSGRRMQIHNSHFSICIERGILYKVSGKKYFLQKMCFLKWNPQPLLHLFSSFQTSTTIFTANIYENCPSSIGCWDSNLRSSGHEYPPITTRPQGFCKKCYQVQDNFERWTRVSVRWGRLLGRPVANPNLKQGLG